MQTEPFFSCEIFHGLWEKHELSCDTKISKTSKKKKKKKKKKREKSEWTPVITSLMII